MREGITAAAAAAATPGCVRNTLMGSTSRNTTPMLLLLVLVLSVEPQINVSVLPHKLLVVSG